MVQSFQETDTSVEIHGSLLTPDTGKTMIAGSGQPEEMKFKYCNTRDRAPDWSNFTQSGVNHQTPLEYAMAPLMCLLCICCPLCCMYQCCKRILRRCFGGFCDETDSQSETTDRLEAQIAHLQDVIMMSVQSQSAKQTSPLVDELPHEELIEVDVQSQSAEQTSPPVDELPHEELIEVDVQSQSAEQTSPPVDELPHEEVIEVEISESHVLQQHEHLTSRGIPDSIVFDTKDGQKIIPIVNGLMSLVMQ